MFAAILMAGFLHAHNIKEQNKVEHKKKKASYSFVCSPVNSDNDLDVQLIRCENSEVICYHTGPQFSCVKKDNKR